MPIKLRDALLETYKDWKKALPREWRGVASGITLDGQQVDGSLELPYWIPIFPTIDPDATILGAPRYAHAFRAFERIRPQEAKVVIVGQDPYPDVGKATGLSFEQGNIRDWQKDSHLVAKSLKRIVQAAAAADTGDSSFTGSRGWGNFVRSVRNGDITAREPRDFFQETREQGVLWLNTTLSISLFRGEGVYGHQSGHRAFWEPLVSHIMEQLATRDEPCVFVLWGSWAKALRGGLIQAAQAAGTGDALGFTEAGHPATPRFLDGNPLEDVNNELERLGLDAIDWI